MHFPPCTFCLGFITGSVTVHYGAGAARLPEGGLETLKITPGSAPATTKFTFLGIVIDTTTMSASIDEVRKATRIEELKLFRSSNKRKRTKRQLLRILDGNYLLLARYFLLAAFFFIA